ncbi:MAG: formylglycine-generating enzyme family protein [Culturomica sp.]|nr:formylglycine-generating enzyme family protein [Culturomica sp.]
MATKGFYIGKYEITQAQWKAVMGISVREQVRLVLEAYKQESKFGFNANSVITEDVITNYLAGEGDMYPIYYVNWHEAQEFCNRLSALTGKHYRLPTEEEWIYAAKGGGYPDNSMINSIDAVEWYKDDNSGIGTHNVGTEQPNSAGIYDMDGNLWEWCEDCYDSSCSSRTLRGGSWCINTPFRIYIRTGGDPNRRHYDHGFRVVLSE